MVTGRIVLGAVGDDDALATVARTLRDAGHEVVYAGGNQSAEQLVRTAIAEDAAELMVSADAAAMGEIDQLRIRLGADDIVLTPAASSGSAPRSPR